jgi:hypothetical protein
VGVEYEMLPHTGNHWVHGNVIKGLKMYLETLPGRHSVDFPSAPPPPKDHVMTVLQSETLSLGGGVHHWSKGISTRGNKTCDNDDDSK